MPKRKAKAKKRTGLALTKPANAHIPDDVKRAKVKMLVLLGYSVEAIARLFDLSRQSIYTHYGTELREGKAEMTTRVAATLVSIATDRTHPKCVDAGKFLIDRAERGFSKDAPKGDENDGPVVFTINIGSAKAPGDDAKVING